MSSGHRDFIHTQTHRQSDSNHWRCCVYLCCLSEHIKQSLKHHINYTAQLQHTLSYSSVPINSIFHSKCQTPQNTDSAVLFTGVCRTKHLNTWLTVALLHRQHLWSANCHPLLVPWHRCFMFGRWDVYDGLELVTRQSMNLARSQNCFRRDLRTFPFSSY